MLSDVRARGVVVKWEVWATGVVQYNKIIEGDRGVGRGDRSTISGSVAEDRRYLLVLNGEVVILMLLVL